MYTKIYKGKIAQYACVHLTRIVIVKIGDQDM